MRMHVWHKLVRTRLKRLHVVGGMWSGCFLFLKIRKNYKLMMRKLYIKLLTLNYSPQASWFKLDFAVEVDVPLATLNSDGKLGE